jgi:hypothetical protein
MVTTSNEVKIGIGDQVFTLKGEGLEVFEADRQNLMDYQKSIEDQIAAKKAAKEATFAKLGLTADETALLLS